MIQVSVIIELREVGPRGAGRAAVGYAKRTAENALAVAELVKHLGKTALTNALRRRQENLDELAEIARDQIKLFL